MNFKSVIYLWTDKFTQLNWIIIHLKLFPWRYLVFPLRGWVGVPMLGHFTLFQFWGVLLIMKKLRGIDPWHFCSLHLCAKIIYFRWFLRTNVLFQKSKKILFFQIMLTFNKKWNFLWRINLHSEWRAHHTNLHNVHAVLSVGWIATKTSIFYWKLT